MNGEPIRLQPAVSVHCKITHRENDSQGIKHQFLSIYWYFSPKRTSKETPFSLEKYRPLSNES